MFLINPANILQAFLYVVNILLFQKVHQKFEGEKQYSLPKILPKKPVKVGKWGHLNLFENKRKCIFVETVNGTINSKLLVRTAFSAEGGFFYSRSLATASRLTSLPTIVGTFARGFINP